MPSKTALITFIILTAALLPHPTLADAPPTSTAPLAVDHTNGVTGDVPYAGTYDFGTILAGSAAPIHHDFVIENVTDQPISVSEIRPSCGCTTANVDAAAPIPPGGRTTIHVTVDTAHLAPPSAEKAVWIYLSGDLTPAATLIIKGNVTPAITFDPPVLDFGDTRPGTAPSRTIKVTIDRRALPTVPAPQATGAPVDIKTVGLALTDGTRVTTTYRVTLSPKLPLGPLNGWLSIPQRDVPAEDRLKAPFAGSVTGEITPQPSVVTLGNIQRTQTSTAYADIVGVTPAAVDGLAVTSKSKGVQTKILRHLADNKVRIQITLSPTKPGPVTGNISVTTRTGQTLNIPITAFVE